MENNPRAKQFMPFASLKGYFDMILQRQRITEPKRELDDSEKLKISDKLSQIKKGMIIKVKYYNLDAYETLEGMVSNINEPFKQITIIKTVINFDDILDIIGEKIVDTN